MRRLLAAITALAAFAVGVAVAPAAAVPTTAPVVSYEVMTARTIVSPLLHLTTGGPYDFYTVARLSVTDVAEGDIIEVDAYGQATTPYLGYTVMHARAIKASCTLDPSPYEGAQIARPMGQNITNAIHHHIGGAGGVHVVSAAEQACGTLHISLVQYAASTAAQPGDYLVVDYAEIALLVIRFRD